MTQKKQPIENDLGLSFMKTLGSTDLSSVTQDLAEVGLDAIFKDGVIKDIPIISTIFGLTNAIVTIKDMLLAHKILLFLYGLKDITTKERNKFINSMEGNAAHQRKVGENLIMLLDRLDDLDKPEMLVKLFKSYLRDCLISSLTVGQKAGKIVGYGDQTKIPNRFDRQSMESYQRNGSIVKTWRPTAHIGDARSCQCHFVFGS